MKLIPLFIFILFLGCAQKHEHHNKHHRFDDAEKWAKIFEDKKRDAWQEPMKILKVLNLKTDSKVADIGSATGYFPVRIAKVIPKGRVWAIDVEPNLVNFLNKRAEKEKIQNLFSVLGTFDDPLIPEKVDYIFIVNTYHHIAKRKKYFENLKASLTKEGKIVIIDFRKGKLPFGPKDEMKISKKNITAEMKIAGYRVAKTYDFLKYQNILVFK